MNKNILDYLYQHAVAKPDDVAFRFLSDSQAPEEITFNELWHECLKVAAFIKQHGCSGERVLLLYPSGLDYVKGFYGCLMAGIIAVPLYPPRKSKKSDRIVKVAQSCKATIALTTSSNISTIEECWRQQNNLGLELNFYVTDELAAQPQELPEYQPENMTGPAFLQYTSGSTGNPKGVVVSHDNIIENVKHLSLTSTGNQDDIFVNWLPLFHDLGLITAILWPVYLGTCSVLMAPATFISNPFSWLKAISLYRGTICGAPNFAYDLCIQKISDEDLSALDLNCWRLAYNAAEPVKAKTLKEFTEKFSVCGFKNNSHYPAYGMAEATAFISGGQALAPVKILYVDKKKLAEYKLELVEEENRFSTAIVSCGVALAPHDLKVVDPKSQTELNEGEIGEVWFAGPTVPKEYWQLEEVSEVTFGQSLANAANADKYLRTGDYGVVWDGEIYITGRMKDLIIFNGVNYYPQDIEASAAEAHEAVRAGYNAAFSLGGDSEKLVVVTELERSYFRKVDTQEVIKAIRQQIFADHDVQVDQVILLKPYHIPTTSSGKIQRKQARHMLVNGEFDIFAQLSEAGEHTINVPKSETEQVVHDIFCLVLKCESVSVTDSFFDLGGDSIMAIEVSAEIGKYYQSLSIDMEQLLELSTIQEIAQYIALQKLHSESRSAALATELSGMLKI